MLSILVFLLVTALLITTAFLFYALGAGKTMAQVVKDLRAGGWTVDDWGQAVQASPAG